MAQLGIESRPPGLRTPQPGPLHHPTNCWTATLFSFYLIGFFHSETNVKELAAQPGIDPRSLDFEHHSLNHYTTVAITESTYSTYIILLLHTWTNFKVLVRKKHF